MATQTKNYGLILPEQEDFYDVDDFNSNATKIDQKLYVQEQEIVGVGKKLDVIGQNVTANGTNITGVGQKVDALSKKLGTSHDTTTDTIFGALANKKEAVYEPNKKMVQQEIKNVLIEESNGVSYSGLVALGHFHAETDGQIYFSASITHNNYTTGRFTAKVYSGFVSESFRNAPAGTAYRSVEPTPLYSSPENSSYFGGAILDVEKGKRYDFFVECNRMDTIQVSFRICYELKTK